MWFVPGGQWTKSQARSVRSCALDEQQALAGEHEEVLLRPLAVVVADRLARLEHVQVQPELLEAALALEVAVEAEGAGVAPAALGAR